MLIQIRSLDQNKANNGVLGQNKKQTLKQFSNLLVK